MAKTTARLDSSSFAGMNIFASVVAMREEPIALPVPNWSRPLPRPIVIPDVVELTTLSDVRILVEKHLPTEYRAKFAWRQLAGLLRRVAEGRQDVAEVSTALRIVLQLEGVKCQ